MEQSEGFKVETEEDDLVCLLYPLLDLVLTCQYLDSIWGTGERPPPRKKI